MNTISWILLAGIVVALIFAVRKIAKGRAEGGCSGCASAGQCDAQANARGNSQCKGPGFEQIVHFRPPR